MRDNQFYGWYDDASQAREKPTYEPPRDAACPFCGFKIEPDDVRTHSLMFASPSYAQRSYFYRTHGTCDEASGAGMDGFILDMIARNKD